MIVIRIDSGETRNRLAQIAGVVERPRAMLAASAGNVARRLRRHFAERDREGNKLGGRRTHFWAEIRNQTEVGAITDQDATVIIGSDKFAQKLHGGTLRAKRPWPGSGLLLLTIPVDPRAYGRRASVTAREEGLKLFFVGSQAGGIIATRAQGSKSIEVLYACKPQVIQAPDPKALPPGDELEQAAIEGAEDHLRAEIQGAQPGAST
jgi:hypothetical protein